MTIAQCCQELQNAAERHASCPCQDHKTGSTVLWTGPLLYRETVECHFSQNMLHFYNILYDSVCQVKICFPSLLIKELKWRFDLASDLS